MLNGLPEDGRPACVVVTDGQPKASARDAVPNGACVRLTKDDLSPAQLQDTIAKALEDRAQRGVGRPSRQGGAVLGWADIHKKFDDRS